MKFISEGLILSDAAMTVSKACSTKTTTPVLECIKISAQNDAVTLIAYDGEISIEKKIKADVLEEGEICVNGRFFSDFMGKVSGMNVVISTGEKGLEIRYGDSESFLQVLSAEEFPLIKAEAGDDYFEVKESSLKSLIAKTVFCCATDESRPILKGCLLETEGSKLHATALDGYRMAVSECEAKTGKGNVKLVCPARTLTEISRMLENGEETLKIYVAKNMLFVSVNDTVLTSRLYTGEFVNKSNIFPSAFTTEVYVSRAELIESVERASILIRGDKNNLIILDIKGGNHSHHGEFGDRERGGERESGNVGKRAENRDERKICAGRAESAQRRDGEIVIQQCDFALHARKQRVERGRIFDFTCKNGRIIA